MKTKDACKYLNVTSLTLLLYYRKGFIKRKPLGNTFDYNESDLKKILEYKIKNENKSFSGFKKRIPWNKGKKFKKTSKLKMSKSRKLFFKNNPDRKKECGIGSKFTIKKIKEKYPFFFKIEEMRYNPNKPGEREIQVHCKNHNCKNSKEQGGWFTPTYIQFYERIRALEKNGVDHAYFYCSEECKVLCPLYYSKGGALKNNKPLPYTDSEYKIFKTFVLERDNYKCQYCGEEAEHVHHEHPQKLEPFFSLDPDFAWSCCKECHYEKGHKDECSTGNLARIICK